MLHNYHKMWSIVEEHSFVSELSALMANPVRADEFMEGAKFVLSRKPDSGTKVTDRIWFLPMMLDDSLSLYYRFDDDNVYLLSIRVVSISDDEDDGTERNGTEDTNGET